MDSVYRMLGAARGCGWQLCLLGWCLEADLTAAEPIRACPVQPKGAWHDTSGSPCLLLCYSKRCCFEECTVFCA